MGLRAASEVPPMFVVTQVTSGQSAEDAPRVGVEIRGTRKDVRIADIVAASGTRRPDAASAPKVFRQAFIYLVSQARESSADLDKLERIRAAWETFFSDSTERRGTMNARLRVEKGDQEIGERAVQEKTSDFLTSCCFSFSVSFALSCLSSAIYTRMSFTTVPKTSVKRKSRPA